MSTWDNGPAKPLTYEDFQAAIQRMRENADKPPSEPTYLVRPKGWAVCQAVARRFPQIDAPTLAAIGNCCDTPEEGIAAARDMGFR